MSLLSANPNATFLTAVQAMTKDTPGHFAPFNAMWQIMLDNDALMWIALSNSAGQDVAFAQRLAAAEQTNAVQSDQILALFSAIDQLQQQVATLQGGTGSTGGNSANITVSFASAATPDAPSAFTATSASSGGAIVANEWSYGDGTVGSGVNVSHTYTSAGRYDVTLLARDGNGASKSVTSRHLVLPPFSRRMPAGGGGQDNYPVSAYYAAAQSTDPETGPPRQTSPEDYSPVSFHLPLTFGPFAPSSAKLRLQGISNAHIDTTLNGATVAISYKYGGAAYQLLANLPVTTPVNGLIDVTFDLPAGFAAGDIWILVEPPRLDQFGFIISSAEILLDYPAEANSPSAMNQSVAFVPRMAARTLTGNDYASFIVGAGEFSTPITRNALLFRARKPYDPLSGQFKVCTAQDATSFAYMLPANATVTGAAVEGDVTITAANGATGGGASLSATPSGGAAATHALVHGEHFSLPVTLASTKGSVDLALQTTMPALTATAANSNQGQEADYKLTVSNLVLRVSFTTP